MTATDQDWITTGEAIRILGFYLSAHTFRDNYQGIIPWVTTPGGHYRWDRQSVEEQARLMKGTG